MRESPSKGKGYEGIDYSDGLMVCELEEGLSGTAVNKTL
jgi:hypothetical protein